MASEQSGRKPVRSASISCRWRAAMHRSSENIGTIAAALAKAQLELTNPAKSLVGILPGMTPNGDRSFRYAPLSSGLDLVRKSLGRYEIATVQTTAIDQEAGLVRLTTVLAHSSGEWVSSEWPVCPVAETASPQRMGTALTYARRYALFTLVGIAGEDDLDAPDLSGSNTAHTRQESLDGTAPSPTGSPNALASSTGNRRSPGPKPLLRAEESAATLDKLQRELEALGSDEELLAFAT